MSNMGSVIVIELLAYNLLPSTYSSLPGQLAYVFDSVETSYLSSNGLDVVSKPMQLSLQALSLNDCTKVSDGENISPERPVYKNLGGYLHKAKENRFSLLISMLRPILNMGFGQAVRFREKQVDSLWTIYIQQASETPRPPFGLYILYLQQCVRSGCPAFSRGIGRIVREL